MSIAPNQLHRFAGTESAQHAVRIAARAQLAPIGLDQQGRHQTRSPFAHSDVFADTLSPDETQGFGFEAAYTRPLPRWERAVLRLREGCTPIRVALVVTYLAALLTVFLTVGWLP